MSRCNDLFQNGFHRWRRLGVFLVLIGVFLAGIGGADAGMRLVVIDPGHGGTDQGAQGPGGTTEKAVALALGRKLAGELRASHLTFLTRSGDYSLGIMDRIAEANHRKAALFVSLHAAGGFQSNIDGISIYYSKEPAGGFRSSDPGGATDASGAADWDTLQLRYMGQSRALAESIRRALEGPAAPVPVRVAGAPLLVLTGADMPAVLVEIGHLTHPATEKRLSDDTLLSILARSIAGGINAYLSGAGSPEAIPLREP